MRTAAIALMAVLCATNVLAQAANTTLGLLRFATADRAVDAGDSEFEIQAATDDTNATVKLSRTISDKNVFNTLQLAASAPLNKSGGATDIAAWSGFPDAFTLTGKYTQYWALGIQDSDDIRLQRVSGAGRQVLKAVCDAVIAGAMANGKSEDDAKALNCDTDNVKHYAPGHLIVFESLLWGKQQKSTLIWGGTGTIGYRAFDVLGTADFKTTKATRTPAGFSVFGAILPATKPMLLTARFEYRDKYKDADSETICHSATATDPQKCMTGAFAVPTETKQKVLSVEGRTSMLDRAVSLKVAYDFENKHWSGDLPIYLVRNADGAFAGGIRAGWEQTKSWQFAVFVNSSFSLMP